MPRRTEAVPITNLKKRRAKKETAELLGRWLGRRLLNSAYVRLLSLPASTASVNAVFSRVVPAHTVVLQISKCVINRCPRWET